MNISELLKFHGKSIKRFEEKWENGYVKLVIVFDDDNCLKIEPYVDKDSKFEINKDDLRMKYTLSIKDNDKNEDV